MYSFFARIGLRRKKTLLPELFHLTWKVSFYRCCVGFLLLTSAITFHVSLVRYVDDYLQPDTTESVLLSAKSDRKVSTEGTAGELSVEPRYGNDEWWKYDSYEKDDYTEKRQGGRRLLEEGTIHGLEEHRRKNDSLKFSALPTRSAKLCRNGHIQGLNAICDSLPCLKILPTPSSPSAFWAPRSDPISPVRLRQLNRIPGPLDALHFTLLPFLTDMQWYNGVWGSVGEIGVAFGKFTALLSLNIDAEAGERLFVSDPFTSSSSILTGLSHYQVFSAHLKDFGFEDDSPFPYNRLFVDRGSSLEHVKRFLLDWNIPRFRLISVDGGSDYSLLRTKLQLATCLIRDGGIIIVDWRESLHVALSTLVSFLAEIGPSSLTPLLTADNKIYLTTTNWKRIYADHLLNYNNNKLFHLNIIDTTFPFGKEVFSVK